MAEAGTLPVVLVHGFLSTREMLGLLGARLWSKGFDVHFTALSPLCVQDVRKLARELDATVLKVLRRTGAPRCHLVGISQGGLIGVYYVKMLDGREKVGRLVSVGTPFAGTWAPAAGMVAVPWLGVVSRGVWQTMPLSSLLRELAGIPLPDGIEATSIAIQGDLIAPPARCRLEGARNVVLEGAPPLIGHQWMGFSPAVADAIGEALTR
jgi:pimeloyl-ACP methyl ester carboxylesterase